MQFEIQWVIELCTDTDWLLITRSWLDTIYDSSHLNIDLVGDISVKVPVLLGYDGDSKSNIMRDMETFAMHTLQQHDLPFTEANYPQNFMGVTVSKS